MYLTGVNRWLFGKVIKERYCFIYRETISGNPCALGRSTKTKTDECGKICVLTQSSYVIGYDRDFHIPLWVSYRLEAKVS